MKTPNYRPVRRLMAAVLVSGMTCVAAVATAAVDMIIMVDGIPGSSRIVPGAIDVHSLSQGMANTFTLGGGAGKVSFSDLTVSKSTDKATPKLMEACAKGQMIPAATLYVRKSIEGKESFLVYELKDVMISSYQVSVHAPGESMQETVSLAFTEIAVSVADQGEATRFNWNVVENGPS